MKKRDPHKISDALFTMQIELIKYEIGGVYWQAQEVRDLNNHLRILAAHSRDLENEVLRLRIEVQAHKKDLPPVSQSSNVVPFPRSSPPPAGHS